jgi:hypothetical protein
MAYLQHQAHGIQGNGPAAESGSTALANKAETLPQVRPGMYFALLVWLGGFLILTAAMFYDLIAALFLRS